CVGPAGRRANPGAPGFQGIGSRQPQSYVSDKAFPTPTRVRLESFCLTESSGKSSVTLYPGLGQRSTRCAQDLDRDRHPPGSDQANHVAVPSGPVRSERATRGDRKSTRLNSSHVKISYAVFCLKK